MAIEKKITGVMVPRHDTALNWSKAVNFVPKQSELVVYDIDTTTYNGSGTATNKDGTTSSFTYESATTTRFKFGDGIHNINVLPFATTEVNLDGYATEDYVATYVAEHTGDVDLSDYQNKFATKVDNNNYTFDNDVTFKPTDETAQVLALKGLVTPIDDNDAVNKKYVDDIVIAINEALEQIIYGDNMSALQDNAGDNILDITERQIYTLEGTETEIVRSEV